MGGKGAMRARLLVLLALGAACETHCFSLVGHTPPRPPARPARFARSTFAHLPVGAASPSAARSSRTTTALFVGGEVVSGSGGSRDVGECKQAVLRAVAKGNKDDVLRAARELEQTGIVQKDEIGGRWSLVFSTQTDATAGADGSIPESVFNQVNAVLYRFFFRFAPFLAGSQDRSASPGIPGVATRNEQLVDLARMAVDNKVELQPARGGPKMRIRVAGELAGSDPASLGVTFTSFSVALAASGAADFAPPLALPLPRPRGRLATTFCDGDVRLSRGGRGGIFVLKRLAAGEAEG